MTRVEIVERVLLEAMWERVMANAGERDQAPSVRDMAVRVVQALEEAS